MAFEELEAIPRGAETPNVYGPADQPLAIQGSQLMGSVRKNDKVITVSNEWKQQPQGQVGIDWNNPLTKKLTAAINFCDRKALIGTYTDQGTLTKVTTSMGFALSGGSNVTVSWLTSNNELNLPITAFYVFSIPTFPGSNVRLLEISATASPNACFLVVTSSGQLLLYWNNTLAVTGPTISATQMYSIGIACTDGTQVLFVNGAAYRGNIAGDCGWVGGNNGGLIINYYNFPTYAVASVVGGYGNFYNLEVAKNLSTNPWQIFKSQTRNIAIPQTPILPSKVGIPGIPEFIREWKQQPQQPMPFIDGVDGMAACQGEVYGSVSGSVTFPSRITDQYVSDMVLANRDGFTTRKGSTGGSYRNYAKVKIPRVPGLTVPKDTPLYIFAYMDIPCPYAAYSGATLFLTGGSGYALAFYLEYAADGTTIRFFSQNAYVYIFNISFKVTSELIAAKVVASIENGVASIRINDTIVAQASFSTDYCFGYADFFEISSCEGSSGCYDAPKYLVAMSAKVNLTKISNPWQIFKPISRKLFVGNNTLPNVQTYRKVQQTLTQQPQANPPCIADYYWMPTLNRGAYQNGASNLTTPKGLAIQGSGSYSRVLDAAVFKDSQYFTMLVSIYKPSGYHCVFYSTPNGGSLAYRIIVGNTNAGPQVFIDNSGSAGPAAGELDGLPDAYNLAVIFDRVNSKLTFVLNGKVSSEISVTLPYNIGGLRDIYNLFDAGTSNLLLSAFFARKTAIEEVIAWTKNPWQIFKGVATKHIPNKTYVKPQPFLPYRARLSDSYSPLAQDNTIQMHGRSILSPYFRSRSSAVTGGDREDGYSGAGHTYVNTALGLFNKAGGGGYSSHVGLTTTGYYTWFNLASKRFTFYVVFNKIGSCSGMVGKLSDPSTPNHGTLTLLADNTFTYAVGNMTAVAISGITAKEGINVMVGITDYINNRHYVVINGQYSQDISNMDHSSYSATHVSGLGASTTGNLSFGAGGFFHRNLTSVEIQDLTRNPLKYNRSIQPTMRLK